MEQNLALRLSPKGVFVERGEQWNHPLWVPLMYPWVKWHAWMIHLVAWYKISWRCSISHKVHIMAPQLSQIEMLNLFLNNVLYRFRYRFKTLSWDLFVDSHLEIAGSKHSLIKAKTSTHSHWIFAYRVFTYLKSSKKITTFPSYGSQGILQCKHIHIEFYP